ncbi:MAG TPA: hypothetical protein VIH71_07910 [Solirubrobacteraceae bacterium]
MARASTASKTSGATVRGRASGRSVDAPWGPTEIQRDYRTLLDRAKDTPQEVLDSDGEVLIIQTKGLAEFQRRLQAQVAETARFMAIFNEHRDVPPSEWALQTAYPWVATFSSDEVAEFALELVADTFDAAQRGTLEHLEGNLRAWASTAGVYGQPDAMRALLSQIDLDGIVEVLPPSEGQVRAAQA